MRDDTTDSPFEQVHSRNALNFTRKKLNGSSFSHTYICAIKYNYVVSHQSECARSQRTRSHVPSSMFVVDRYTWKIIKCSRIFFSRWIDTTKKQTVIYQHTQCEWQTPKWQSETGAHARLLQCDHAKLTALISTPLECFTLYANLRRRRHLRNSMVFHNRNRQSLSDKQQQQQYSGHSITRQHKLRSRKENVANTLRRARIETVDLVPVLFRLVAMRCRRFKIKEAECH